MDASEHLNVMCLLVYLRRNHVLQKTTTLSASKFLLNFITFKDTHTQQHKIKHISYFSMLQMLFASSNNHLFFLKKTFLRKTETNRTIVTDRCYLHPPIKAGCYTFVLG